MCLVLKLSFKYICEIYDIVCIISDMLAKLQNTLAQQANPPRQSINPSTLQLVKAITHQLLNINTTELHHSTIKMPSQVEVLMCCHIDELTTGSRVDRFTHLHVEIS